MLLSWGAQLPIWVVPATKGLYIPSDGSGDVHYCRKPDDGHLLTSVGNEHTSLCVHIHVEYSASRLVGRHRADGSTSRQVISVQQFHILYSLHPSTQYHLSSSPRRWRTPSSKRRSGHRRQCRPNTTSIRTASTASQSLAAALAASARSSACFIKACLSPFTKVRLPRRLSNHPPLKTDLHFWFQPRPPSPRSALAFP